MQYLGQPSDKFRVDVHKLLLAMDKAGVKWDDYCAEIGLSEPAGPHLPSAFVFPLLERLKLKEPNSIFARPPRSEMSRADNDDLLRALIPRVDHVTYRSPRDLDPTVEMEVREAVSEFASSLHIQRQSEAGVLRIEGDPLPHLVYAGDGEELRTKLEELGLVMYIAVIPHLVNIDGVVPKAENMWPFAFGNSLYLDIARHE